MKYLKLVLFAIFIFGTVSCGESPKKKTHIETSESMEIDETNIMEEDEVDYLESALNALDVGDNAKAIEKIMKAVDHIKSYLRELDDPVHANNAIETLLEITMKIKNGTKMSADDLEEALMKLEYFSDDDLDFDDEEIEEDTNDSEV